MDRFLREMRGEAFVEVRADKAERSHAASRRLPAFDAPAARVAPANQGHRTGGVRLLEHAAWDADGGLRGQGCVVEAAERP